MNLVGDRLTLTGEHCDKCGAKAYVATILTTGTLTWCRHDWREVREGISPYTLHLIDETEHLEKD